MTPGEFHDLELSSDFCLADTIVQRASELAHAPISAHAVNVSIQKQTTWLTSKSASGRNDEAESLYVCVRPHQNREGSLL